MCWCLSIIELYLDLRVKKLHNYGKLFYSTEEKTKLPALPVRQKRKIHKIF